MRSVYIVLLSVVTLALTAGCAQDSTTVGQPSTALGTGFTFTGTTTTTTTTTGTGTGTAVLAANTAALGDFFFQSQPSSPTSEQIQLSVSDDGSGHWGGTVTISYNDAYGAHSDTMSTTFGSASDDTPNVWFNYVDPATGLARQVWHGFFQDAYGAVVVVIDQTVGLGDGTPGTMSGRVYYQNFGVTPPAQGPESMCWQIEVGPYDCRTFIEGSTGTGLDDHGTVNTTMALNPNNHTDGRPAYQLLGSFSGMSYSDVFSE